MLKFINNLATIEINKEVDAVQLTFRSPGSLQQYNETLSMAVSFASMHSISSYLFIKDQFDDINSTHFHTLVQNWLLLLKERIAGDRAAKTKVAVLISAETFDKIAGLIQQLTDTSQPHTPLLFTYHTNYTQACHFLNASVMCEEKYIAG